MMARYCQFWKNSSSLEECAVCSPNVSTARAVRCKINVNETTMFTQPEWIPESGAHNAFVNGHMIQIGHYTLSGLPTLMFDTNTSLLDIPDVHVQASLTFVYNMYMSGSERCRTVSGPFWNRRPSAYQARRVSTF